MSLRILKPVSLVGKELIGNCVAYFGKRGQSKHRKQCRCQSGQIRDVAQVSLVAKKLLRIFENALRMLQGNEKNSERDNALYNVNFCS